MMAEEDRQTREGDADCRDEGHEEVGYYAEKGLLGFADRIGPLLACLQSRILIKDGRVMGVGSICEVGEEIGR